MCRAAKKIWNNSEFTALMCFLPGVTEERNDKGVCVRLQWTKMGGEKEREWEKLKPTREHCETGSVQDERSRRKLVAFDAFSHSVQAASQNQVSFLTAGETHAIRSQQTSAAATHTHTHTHTRYCRDEHKCAVV